MSIYANLHIFILFVLSTFVCEIDKRGADSYKHAMDSSLLRKYLGERIKSRRNQLGMKQKDLASRMGVSRATLANVETGRQNMLLHHLYLYAEELELDVTDLLPDPADLQSPVKENELPLPGNLSRLQKAQIARLMRGETAATGTNEGGPHDTKKKGKS